MAHSAASAAKRPLVASNNLFISDIDGDQDDNREFDDEHAQSLYWEEQDQLKNDDQTVIEGSGVSEIFCCHTCADSAGRGSTRRPARGANSSRHSPLKRDHPPAIIKQHNRPPATQRLTPAPSATPRLTPAPSATRRLTPARSAPLLPQPAPFAALRVVQSCQKPLPHVLRSLPHLLRNPD